MLPGDGRHGGGASWTGSMPLASMGAAARSSAPLRPAGPALHRSRPRPAADRPLVRPTLAAGGHLPRGARPSRRRDPASVVGPCHRPHHALPARPVLDRDPARCAPRPPRPLSRLHRCLVPQTAADLRRHPRRRATPRLRHYGANSPYPHCPSCRLADNLSPRLSRCRRDHATIRRTHVRTFSASRRVSAQTIRQTASSWQLLKLGDTFSVTSAHGGTTTQERPSGAPSPALSALFRKRAEVAGEAEALAHLLDRLRAVLSHLDAAIRILCPEARPELIKPKVPGRRGCDWFGRASWGAWCLTRSGRPQRRCR